MLRSVLAIYCLGFRSGHRGLPWYAMTFCVVASVCILVVLVDLHSGSSLAIFFGALLSGRLDVSWYPYGLLRIALICFVPVCLELPGLYLGCCDLPWISVLGCCGLLWISSPLLC